ncbi:unnamed protein product, partial [Symbiodinium sp. KB8]
AQGGEEDAEALSAIDMARCGGEVDGLVTSAVFIAQCAEYGIDQQPNPGPGRSPGMEYTLGAATYDPKSSTIAWRPSTGSIASRISAQWPPRTVLLPLTIPHIIAKAESSLQRRVVQLYAGGEPETPRDTQQPKAAAKQHKGKADDEAASFEKQMVASLKEIIRTQDEELRSLKEKLTAATRNRQDTEEDPLAPQVEALKHDRDQLQEELNNWKQRCSQEAKAQAEAAAAAAPAPASDEDGQGEADGGDAAEFDRLYEELHEERDRADDADRRAGELSAQLAHVEAVSQQEIAALREELEAARAAAGVAPAAGDDEEGAAAKAEVARLQQEVEELQRQLAVQEGNASAAEQVSQLQGQLEQAEQRHQDNLRFISQLQEEKEGLQRRLEGLERQATEERQQWQQQLEALETADSSGKASAQAAADREAALRDRVAELERAVEDLESEGRRKEEQHK